MIESFLCDGINKKRSLYVEMICIAVLKRSK